MPVLTAATIPDRFTVRLDAHDRHALATIAGAIGGPHRRPLTTSEAMRAALGIARNALGCEGSVSATPGA